MIMVLMTMVMDRRLFGPCGIDVACIDVEICGNGIDDDGNGDADCDDLYCCADVACATTPSCSVGGEFDCADGVDNDSDGLTDCDDSDCAVTSACSENCSNLDPNTLLPVDDDGDGDANCDDSDCTNDPACLGGGEDCTNGVDDDGDGDADCMDSDCSSNQCVEQNCNQADDDGDLMWTVMIQIVPMILSVGQSNLAWYRQRWWNVDCDDSQCVNNSVCQGETNCGDGQDNDQDGDTDCADTDCLSDPGCGGIFEGDCVNGMDDDGMV